MDSWVYLFSRFTSEALYIQLFLILSVTAGYCIFWVTQKRKHGSIDKVVPSSIVQTYLNELISEAQVIRAQLFGLLSDAGLATPDQKISIASLDQVAEKIANDPELAGKLKELQMKLTQQESAMTNIVSEKQQLEKELERIKSAQESSDGTAPAEGGAEAEVVNNLKEKIKNLEDRLSEYSIIEDDLANLKKLQQENSELKAAIDGKGAAPKPEKKAEPIEPEDKAEAKTEPSETKEEAKADEPKQEDEQVAAPTDDPNFEGLVDKVEASLSEESKSEEASAQEEPKSEEAKEQSASGEETKQDDPLSNVGKSDDDLLSEFEKMLNM